MLAALLITCATWTQAPSDAPESIATAPRLPPWPPGLSEPRDGPDGTRLAPDLAEATNRRLRACQALPGRCQTRLDALWATCDARVRGAVRVERADCLGSAVEAKIETAGRWRTWEVVLVALGIGLMAGGIGTGVGVVVAR